MEILEVLPEGPSESADPAYRKPSVGSTNVITPVSR
jgi:hypothetical protein